MQKRPKRPRDPNQLGKLIVDLSVGEASNMLEASGKDPAAVVLGMKGGRARAKKLTSKQRTEIAKIAAAARWKKTDR